MSRPVLSPQEVGVTLTHMTADFIDLRDKLTDAGVNGDIDDETRGVMAEAAATLGSFANVARIYALLLLTDTPMNFFEGTLRDMIGEAKRREEEDE